MKVDTIIMLPALDFTIHPIKSVLKSTQSVIYLVFFINSIDMTLKFTEEKKQEIYVPNFLKNHNPPYDLQHMSLAT